MSDRRGSDNPNPGTAFMDAPRSRPSRRRDLGDVLDIPQTDNGMLIDPRAVSTHRYPENNDARSRQRARSMPPTGRRREQDAQPDEGSRYMEPYPLPETHFDLICNPGRTRDVSVHLEFTVFDDLDDQLEEFNQFMRLGQFGTAKTFFEEHLATYVANPWVFVQYAEMLFQMGDYKSLLQLNAEPIFRYLDQGPESKDSEAMKKLELNWKLLKACSLCQSQYEMQPVREVYQPHQTIPSLERLGSTEIRIICLVMRLMCNFNTQQYVCTSALSSNLADWGDWGKLYQELLVQRRIWDFRDLFTAASAAFGLDSAQEQFLKGRKLTAALDQDWCVQTEGEKANRLAVIDILVLVTKPYVHYEVVAPVAEENIHMASRLAKDIIREIPSCSKTRPLLQFLITQSAISLRRATTISSAYSYLFSFAGLPNFGSPFGMPYYIPIYKEIPGWEPLGLPENSSEPLEMALKASRELKDYQAQALCLNELAIRSREPAKYFEELAWLQKEVQQDMLAYLGTCFSRYLIARDSESKATLLSDLNDIGLWQQPSEIISPFHACLREIMQIALSPSQSAYLTKSLLAGERYLGYLPQWLDDSISKHVALERNPTLDTPRRAETPEPSTFERNSPPEHGSSHSYQFPGYDSGSSLAGSSRGRPPTSPEHEC